MKNNGGESITFVNFNTAYRVIPNRIAYSASKSGQLGMMRAMANKKEVEDIMGGAGARVQR